MKVIGLLLCALATISCAEPPVERMEAARQELAALEELAAVVWAPAQLAAAVKAVEGVEEELAAQARRFAWNREYGKASVMLALAMEDMERARSASAAAKQEAEELAWEALDTASYAVDHFRSALLIAPVARRGAPSVRHLDQELSGTERRLNEVRDLILQGDYSEAVARAEELLERVSSLLAAVSRASGS